MAGKNAAFTQESAVATVGKSRKQTASENGRNNGGDSGTSSSRAGATGTSTSSGTSGAVSSGSGEIDSGSSTVDDIIGGSENDSGSRSELGTDSGGSSSDGSDSRTRTRTRTSGSGARSGRTRATGTNASEETQLDSEVLSRVEPTPKKTKGIVEEEIKFPDSAKELIGDLYSLAFWIAAQVTATPDVALETEEATDLGAKTEKFVASLGKRRATNVMKSLGKFGPAVTLVSGLAMVAVPRAKLVIRKRKGGNVQQANTEETASTADATETGAASPAGHSSNNGAGYRERSFAARDFEEISPGHDRQNF